MKILNPNRFYVEKGDRLTYNSKAMEWMRIYGISGCSVRAKWPTAEKMNLLGPRVCYYVFRKGFDRYKSQIEVWVKYNNSNCTGISGMISRIQNADAWFLNIKGAVYDNCPYPLFLKVKK